MYRYLLFDLDGTLTDPGLGITNSVMYALEKYGIRVEERSELYSFIGPPLLDSFMDRYGFDSEKAMEAISYYREYFSKKGLYENVVYDRIPEVLSALREKGFFLSLATSKPEPFAREILVHFDLLKYFDFVAGSLMNETRTAKHEVIGHILETLDIRDGASVLMIGDRSHDVMGARHFGLACMGVTYGYGDYEELKDAGADYIVDSPDQMLETILKVTGGRYENQ